MFVIAGLGNPGRKYENTKHNVGFLTVDALGEKYGIPIRKIKHKALVGEGRIQGEKVLLVKPQTYMNLSGESLREVVRYCDVAPEEIMVVYDDADIPLGTIRMRKKGSAGTHNGMKSIIYHLQFDDFPRLRIGIGKPDADMVDFVLSGFSSQERPLMRTAMEQAVLALETWVTEGVEMAMSRYNTTKRRKDSPEAQGGTNPQDGRGGTEGEG